MQYTEFYKTGSFLGKRKPIKENFCHGQTTEYIWHVSALITWLRTGYDSLGLWSFHPQSTPVFVSMLYAGPEKWGCKPYILQSNWRGLPNRSGDLRSGAILSYF